MAKRARQRRERARGRAQRRARPHRDARGPRHNADGRRRRPTLLSTKVASLETKVAANDKAMAEAGKRFKQLKEKAKRLVEEESAKLKPLQARGAGELRARLADGGAAPVQDDSRVKDLEKEVKALKKQLREAPKPKGSGDERVRSSSRSSSGRAKTEGGEAELLREELAEAKKKAHAMQAQRGRGRATRGAV